MVLRRANAGGKLCAARSCRGLMSAMVAEDIVSTWRAVGTV